MWNKPTSSKWLVLAMGLALLSCSSQPEGELDPKLFANDSLLQTIERHITPRSYWKDKVEALQTRGDQAREKFRQGFAAYQNLLRERRKFMTGRMAELKAAGKDPNQGRQEAISQFRQEVDRLRNENRELAKQLQQEDQLLAQAQRALFQSR
ncbi:MAG: hypothetical protein G8345_02455 [Magnetococcales bacterium]|nr:hypothetical protein [Magnetococcales bacterium]NGZ25732.1 hypothetical protein [Magnetococcales bacterium]